jgi:hypothetical protein
MNGSYRASKQIFLTCNFTCKNPARAVTSRTSAVPDAFQVVGSTCSRPFDTVEVCGSSPHGPTTFRILVADKIMEGTQCRSPRTATWAEIT